MGNPVNKTGNGSVYTRGRGTTTEVTRETDKKNRNVTTTTTRGNNETQRTTTSRTHTSRKGNEFTKTKTTEGSTQQGGVKKGIKPVETNLFTVEKGAKRHEVKGTGPGGIETNAYIQGPSFKMDGNASVSRKGMGIDVDINLKIDANAVSGGVGATKTFRFEFQGEQFEVKVKLGADGKVGVNGELKLKLHVGKDGVQVKVAGEVFAGATGTLSGGIDVSMNGKKLAGAEAKVTFGAGAGAGFDADVDVLSGKFHAKAYAFVGVGVGVDLSGQVNAMEIAKAVPKLLW